MRLRYAGSTREAIDRHRQETWGGGPDGEDGEGDAADEVRSEGAPVAGKDDADDEREEGRGHDDGEQELRVVGVVGTGYSGGVLDADLPELVREDVAALERGVTPPSGHGVGGSHAVEGGGDVLGRGGGGGGGALRGWEIADAVQDRAELRPSLGGGQGGDGRGGGVFVVGGGGGDADGARARAPERWWARTHETPPRGDSASAPPMRSSSIGTRARGRVGGGARARARRCTPRSRSASFRGVTRSGRARVEVRNRRRREPTLHVVDVARGHPDVRRSRRFDRLCALRANTTPGARAPDALRDVVSSRDDSSLGTARVDVHWLTSRRDVLFPFSLRRVPPCTPPPRPSVHSSAAFPSHTAHVHASVGNRRIPRHRKCPPLGHDSHNTNASSSPSHPHTAHGKSSTSAHWLGGRQCGYFGYF